MTTIDDLIPRVVSYLDTIGALRGNPVFEKEVAMMIDELSCDGIGCEGRPTLGKVEVHESVFNEIDSQLPRISFDEIQQRALDMIPDSEETVIVDVGSHIGYKGGGYLAKHKPHANVILLDFDPSEDNKYDYLFMDGKSPHRLVFESGQGIIHDLSKPFEQRVNELYHANGITNIEFLLHELVPGEVPEFLESVSDRAVYLIGQKAPRNLSFITGGLYNVLEAQHLGVTMTALEKMPSEDLAWEVVKENIGLSDEQIKGYIASVFDQKSFEGEFSRKYDYKDPAQQRVGVMLKTGLALALAGATDGDVLRFEDANFYSSFNQIDHYVEANRE